MVGLSRPWMNAAKLGSEFMARSGGTIPRRRTGVTWERMVDGEGTVDVGCGGCGGNVEGPFLVLKGFCRSDLPSILSIPSTPSTKEIKNKR